MFQAEYAVGGEPGGASQPRKRWKHARVASSAGTADGVSLGGEDGFGGPVPRTFGVRTQRLAAATGAPGDCNSLRRVRGPWPVVLGATRLEIGRRWADRRERMGFCWVVDATVRAGTVPWRLMMHRRSWCLDAVHQPYGTTSLNLDRIPVSAGVRLRHNCNATSGGGSIRPPPDIPERGVAGWAAQEEAQGVRFLRDEVHYAPRHMAGRLMYRSAPF